MPTYRHWSLPSSQGIVNRDYSGISYFLINREAALAQFEIVLVKSLSSSLIHVVLGNR